MRTTLTLDDDLANALSRKARLWGRSFKVVVNAAIRLGLACGDNRAVTIQAVVVAPQACGLMSGIDPLRLNQLVEGLELEACFVKATRDGEGV